jgi:hypothetical protein
VDATKKDVTIRLIWRFCRVNSFPFIFLNRKLTSSGDNRKTKLVLDVLLLYSTSSESTHASTKRHAQKNADHGQTFWPHLVPGQRISTPRNYTEKDRPTSHQIRAMIYTPRMRCSTPSSSSRTTYCRSCTRKRCLQFTITIRTFNRWLRPRWKRPIFSFHEINRSLDRVS